jgi:hypothetical protein
VDRQKRPLGAVLIDDQQDDQRQPDNQGGECQRVQEAVRE